MPNYILLERIELNASAASVTFANIPQSGYTDLKIVASTRSAASVAVDALYGRFNSSSTGYTNRILYGETTGTGSFSPSISYAHLGYGVGGNGTANTFSNLEIYIPNYTSSNNKSVSVDAVTETNATTAQSGVQSFEAALWSNSAAITSITFTQESGNNFTANSTFSLYGLAALGTTPVIAPKAFGGNIDYDGTYFIHTFLSSGTFTPNQSLSCEYLVVAGGGGGAYGGAGGAGGYRASSASLSTTQTIVVGAGGAGGFGGPGNYNVGKGTASSLGAISSTGGGNGIYYNQGGADGDGGSGGGTVDSTRGGAPGDGTSGQGNNGGQGSSDLSTYTTGGGGGGASAVGSAGTSSGGGNGGAGTATSISGTSTTYAGGGGGGGDSGRPAGTGGAGGGGNGSDSASGSAGTLNRGGGGGGASGSGSGGAGGSGIVIIRYLAA
jgi:hypothetical protein